MLTNWRTRLHFDSFMLDWVDIDNGIVQGDPLSMLLYLFYNTDLIASPKKGEAMIAYVDDASYYAEGTNFEEAYDRLHDMMNRDQGGYKWSDQHNSQFEPGKMAIVGFSRRRTADPHCLGRMIPEPRPKIGRAHV